MYTFNEIIKKYWNHYLNLESEFLNTQKYVEFSIDNKNTFSIEYLKLFLCVCSEIDCIGQILAKTINNNFKIENCKHISKWWKEIESAPFFSELISKYKKESEENKKISDSYVHNYIIDEDISPWKGFKAQDKSTLPHWWDKYNLVKHHRMEIREDGKTNYHYANLGNLFEAFAALYILEITLLEKTGSNEDFYNFENNSKLFSSHKILPIPLIELESIFK